MEMETTDKRCTDCEFCQSSARLNCLGGEGPGNGVMFVSQAPTVAEEQLLRPLVGETGHLFEELLVEAGLVRYGVRITNAIRCKPLPDSKPVQKHIDACRYHLVQEIIEHKPKVIVVLGAEALNSVLGMTGITSLRGRFFVIDKIGNTDLGFSVTVYCSLMPAILFRRWEDHPLVVEDFRKLGRLVRNEWIEEKLGNYTIPTTVAEVKEYFDYLHKCHRVAFDLETTTFNFWDFNLNPNCNILCASFSGYPGTGFVVPLLRQHAKPYWSPEDELVVRGILNDFFKSDVDKWAQNGIFDINFLRANGFDFNLESFVFDTMLGHHTLQENTPHGLNTLIGSYTNMPAYFLALKDWQEENGKVKTYAEFPDDMLWEYAGADADATVTIGDALQSQLKTDMTQEWIGGIWQPIPLEKFFHNLVMPLNRALIDIEYRGLVLDVDFLMEIHKETMQIESEQTQKFNELLGREINLRSTIQLQGALFNSPTAPQNPGWDGNGINGKPFVPGLGLPILKRTPKKKPSTDESVLATLSKKFDHPALKAMMLIRKCQKKISTYLAGRDGKSGMLKFLVEMDGRVHPGYKQHSVVTGRLATSEPAIHNIPNPDKDPEYARVRLVFGAPEGWWLLQCDYSQLELRIAATVSQEETMLQAFADGKDVHTWTASEIYGTPYEEVTKAVRGKAKAIGFGLIYGKQAYSLSQDLGVSVEEAQHFIDLYFKRFSGLARYFERQLRCLTEHGFASNNYGRKRRLYGYHFLDEARMRKYSSNEYFLKSCKMRRFEMERQIVNFGIQSTGSETLSRATALVHQEYKKRKMKSGIVISHHDALYVETPPEEIYEAAKILVDIMEAPVPELNNASFPVDLEVGPRWGEINEEATKAVNGYIRDISDQ